MVVLHPVEIPRFVSAVFSSLPDSFAAVLAVKGALTPRLNCGAPLTAPGRCKPAPLGRKSKNKNTTQLLLRGGVVFWFCAWARIFTEKPCARIA